MSEFKSELTSNEDSFNELTLKDLQQKLVLLRMKTSTSAIAAKQTEQLKQAKQIRDIKKMIAEKLRAEHAVTIGGYRG